MKYKIIELLPEYISPGWYMETNKNIFARLYDYKNKCILDYDMYEMPIPHDFTTLKNNMDEFIKSLIENGVV